MKPKHVFLSAFICLSVFSFLGCFSRVPVEPKNSSQARLNLPNWGIVIDASYDPKLDDIVPGYKVLTVALTNRSVDIVKLDPVRDQWGIEDARGQKQKAIASLQIYDPEVWTQLPGRVKDLVDYPAGVQMGFTQTFNLFFPERVDLERFRAINFYSATLKQNFDALSSSSMERAVPANDATGGSVEKYTPPPSLKKK